VLTENDESNSCSEEHVGAVAQRSRERKGQKGHLSKVLTSAEKLLRFGVGGNKLLSSLNQVIYPHSPHFSQPYSRVRTLKWLYQGLQARYEDTLFGS